MSAHSLKENFIFMIMSWPGNKIYVVPLHIIIYKECKNKSFPRNSKRENMVTPLFLFRKKSKNT